MLAHSKTFQLLVPLMLLTLALPAGARGEDAKPSEDRKKFQGAWTAAAPVEGAEKSTYTFKDDKLTVKAPGRTYEITVTLDEAAKPERSIDMKIDAAPDEAKGKTSKGIYKFDGDDKLLICFRPEGERPTKFEQVEMEQFLITLTRVKGESK